MGDGRVYLRQAGVLHVLSAANVLTPVPDHLGDPVTHHSEHLIYDAPTNALIGVTRTSAGGIPCAGFTEVALNRYPLNAAGTALNGPIVCASLTVGSTSPIGLDPLPSGDILLTFADRRQFQSNDLWAVDPLTLTAVSGAVPDYADLDGGVWCQAIGKAVVLNDAGNDLRTYTLGQAGAGTLLPVSVPVGGSTTGTSTTNYFTDVDHTAAPCSAFVQEYGGGLAGLGGKVPHLGAATCPRVGTVLPITVSNAVGAGKAFVAFSTNQVAVPGLGGTLLVGTPYFATRATTLTGFVGQVSGGWAQVTLALPNNAMLVGFPFFAQAAVRDPAGAQGWSLTQGLELRAQ